MFVKDGRRGRTVENKLTDDPRANVERVGQHRFGEAVKAIRTFGKCGGKRFGWTENEIQQAESVLLHEVRDAIESIRLGDTNDIPMIFKKRK